MQNRQSTIPGSVRNSRMTTRCSGRLTIKCLAAGSRALCMPQRFVPACWTVSVRSLMGAVGRHPEA